VVKQEKSFAMFEERPRKFHFYHDQEGALIPHSNKPFANTLCKMNSAVPESHITTDLDRVTCKICLRDARFREMKRKTNINREYGKMASAYPLHVQMFGRALRPGFVNGIPSRYRRNWRGKLILQVQDTVPVNYDERDPYDTGPTQFTGRWRDATLEDLGGGVV
jgi:hypothetical protein